MKSTNYKANFLKKKKSNTAENRVTLWRARVGGGRDRDVRRVGWGDDYQGAITSLKPAGIRHYFANPHLASL